MQHVSVAARQTFTEVAGAVLALAGMAGLVLALEAIAVAAHAA